MKPNRVAAKLQTLATIAALGERYGFSREPSTLDTTVVVLRRDKLTCTVRTGRTYGTGQIQWGMDHTATQEEKIAWLNGLDRKIYGPCGLRLISTTTHQLAILEQQFKALPAMMTA